MKTGTGHWNGWRQAVAILVGFTAISWAAPEPAVKPPPNGPAEVTWNADDGSLALRYHGAVILNAVVEARDKGGRKTAAGLKLKPEAAEGEKVEQRLTISLAEPKEGVELVLLVKDSDHPQIKVTVDDEMPAQPFKSTAAPVRMTLKGFRTDVGGWGTYRDDLPARAVEPPTSPVEASGKVEGITLIPYGSAQCRIAHFPWATRD